MRLCILVLTVPNRACWVLVLLPAAFHKHYKPLHLAAAVYRSSCKAKLDRSYYMVRPAAWVCSFPAAV